MIREMLLTISVLGPRLFPSLLTSNDLAPHNVRSLEYFSCATEWDPPGIVNSIFPTILLSANSFLCLVVFIGNRVSHESPNIVDYSPIIVIGSSSAALHILAFSTRRLIAARPPPPVVSRQPFTCQAVLSVRCLKSLNPRRPRGIRRRFQPFLLSLISGTARRSTKCPVPAGNRSSNFWAVL